MIVCWPRPSPNQVALNTDGSSYGNPGRAGFGGLIRDEDGIWIIGFNGHLHFADALEAELLAILHGLRIAWELHFTDVSCRSDCMEALCMILNPIPQPHKYAKIVFRIKELIDRDWSISFHHTHRESNQCADFLAKAGANCMRGGSMVFRQPPNALASLLSSDAKGTGYERR